MLRSGPQNLGRPSKLRTSWSIVYADFIRSLDDKAAREIEALARAVILAELGSLLEQASDTSSGERTTHLATRSEGFAVVGHEDGGPYRALSLELAADCVAVLTR